MRKSVWSRLLICNNKNKNAVKTLTTTTTTISQQQQSCKISAFTHFTSTNQSINHHQHYYGRSFFCTSAYSSRESARVVHDLLAELEKEKQREREKKKRSGIHINEDDNEEEEEDYMGVGPLIERLQKDKEKAKKISDDLLFRYEEPSDSDSDDDMEDDDHEKKMLDQFERKFQRHSDLLNRFNDSGTPELELFF